MRISDWSSDVCSSDLPSSFDIERWIILFDPRRHASVCASRQFDVESRNIRRRGGCCDLLCSVQRLDNRGKLNRAHLWQVDPAHMSNLKIGGKDDKSLSAYTSDRKSGVKGMRGAEG